MDENEFIELLVAWLPDDPELWIGSIMAGCALLTIVLPKPDEKAHPLVKIGHKAISILGLGAGRLRSAGKIGKLARVFRRKP